MQTESKQAPVGGPRQPALTTPKPLMGVVDVSAQLSEALGPKLEEVKEEIVEQEVANEARVALLRKAEEAKQQREKEAAAAMAFDREQSTYLDEPPARREPLNDIFAHIATGKSTAKPKVIDINDEYDLDNMEPEDAPDGYALKNVLEDGEWVRKLVSLEVLAAQAVEIRSLDSRPRDAYSLPPSVTDGGGKWGGMDYRWEAPEENSQSMDHAHDNGFRIARFRGGEMDNSGFEVDRDGTVRKGALVLCCRPKEVTQVRAHSMADLNARMMGEQIEEYLAPEAGGHEIPEEHGSFFVDRDHKLSGGGAAMSAEEMRDINQRQHERAMEEGMARSRGRSVSASFNLPWQRDKIEERHGNNPPRPDRYYHALGSVGGGR